MNATEQGIHVERLYVVFDEQNKINAAFKNDDEAMLFAEELAGREEFQDDIPETHKHKRNGAYRKIADLAHEKQNNIKDMRGLQVKIVKGKNVPVGAIGKVFWQREFLSKFRQGTYLRLGIDIGQAEPVWTAADNVEVVWE